MEPLDQERFGSSILVPQQQRGNSGVPHNNDPYSSLQTLVTQQVVEPTLRNSTTLRLQQNDDHLQQQQQQQDYSYVTSTSTTTSQVSSSLSPQSSIDVPPHLVSSPPPLTSQDIAALRKTLSGRPKLRRVCQICGRECPSRHKLQRHLSTHSEERPYKCKVCGKAFKWTEYLSKHMRTQHGAPAGSSNVKHISTMRSTGSSGSISSTEDLNSAANTPTTPSSSSNNNHSRSSSSKHHPNSLPLRSNTPTDHTTIMASQNNNKTVVTCNHSSSSNTGYNTANSNSSVNRDQSTPDVFSPTSYDGLLLTDTVNSSTHLQGNPSTPGTAAAVHQSLIHSYSTNGAASYFPTSFSYHPSPFSHMNCYGYPPTQLDMNQYFNTLYPSSGGFDPNYASTYNMRPTVPLQTTQTQQDLVVVGSTDKGHSNHVNSILTNTDNNTTNHCISSSVSCQTHECSTDMESNGGSSKVKRPPVVIINMCKRKDVGIQCEVGDETLQALFEEEDQLNNITNTTYSNSGSFDSNSSVDTSADESLGSICKYPCEFNGCSRSYVHRKDLIRHMKATHRSIPKLLQPKVVETPSKPFICQVSDCGKSYYHLKDLRRHQRQCHLGGLSLLDHHTNNSSSSSCSSGSLGNNHNSQIEVILDDASSLRYPCDFKGCAKSYIHKKDLIRHKRTYHQDNSSHPSIPEPVIVIHIKKGKDKNSEDDTLFDESSDSIRSFSSSSKRFRLNSSAEPLNTAQLPISNQQPILTENNSGDLSCLNSPNILENISAAVANIFDMDRSPLNMFPMDTLTTPSSSSNSTNLAISVNSTAAGTTDDTLTDKTNSNNMYGTPVSSPSALFMTLLSQNI